MVVADQLLENVSVKLWNKILIVNCNAGPLRGPASGRAAIGQGYDH